MSRIQIVRVGAFCLLLVIWFRLLHVCLGLGPWHHAKNEEFSVSSKPVPTRRGAIVSADAMLLAGDAYEVDLEFHYRYLQQSLDVEWLREQARSRLPAKQRGDPRQIERRAGEIAREIHATRASVSALTGIEMTELLNRFRRVEDRVERIARLVNAKQRERQARLAASGQDNALTEAPLAIAEQKQYHTILRNVSQDVVLQFSREVERFPGVQLRHRIRRHYPNGALAASVLGFTHPGDSSVALVGVSGLEKQYDSQLRGVVGQVRQLVRPRGGHTSPVGGTPPVAGTSIDLTLNASIQRTAERALTVNRHHWKSAAVVVMEARSGALIVTAAAPSFNANHASRPNSREATAIRRRTDAPLFNRVAQMAIAPGSVFKVITALTALRLGQVPSSFVCRGYLHSPERHRCLVYRRHGVGHGPLSLEDALARSCNVYFFQLAEQIGWQEIARTARMLGFGTITGIDLPNESSGRIPQTIRADQTLQCSIGQGELQVTPIQVAVALAAVANMGGRVVPHLRDQAFQLPIRIGGILPEHWARIRKGLALAVSSPQGTGNRQYFLSDVAVAGKTGTAQTNRETDHVWFAGYLPADRPKYVIVLALEHAAAEANAGSILRSVVGGLRLSGYLKGSVQQPQAVSEATAGHGSKMSVFPDSRRWDDESASDQVGGTSEIELLESAAARKM